MAECRLRQSLRCSDRIGLDFFTIDISHGVAGLITQQINLPAHQIVDGHGHAFVGNGGEFGFHGCLPQQTAQMGGRAYTGIAQVGNILVFANPG